ncbi:hypothetical protein [Candidatus Tisiphia endosymbiont of Beris chalybata]|uniref:hypothetical protein n=1 Tax=Candidatus Tisiphia endosymbiont of Beris chalybata TaxID=3066262 RepID=UPI00312C76AB
MPLEDQETPNQETALIHKIALREFSLGITLPFIGWRIPIGAAHLFYVRYDEKGNIIDELHGLSCDRTTEQFKPIGWSGDLLRVVQYSHKTHCNRPDVGEFYGLYQPGQKEKIVKIGTESEITDCWDKALQAAARLNSLNINYELLGYKIYGRVDNNIQEGNSNSIVYTLGKFLGFSATALSKKLTPGLGKNLLCDSLERDEVAAGEVAITDTKSLVKPASNREGGEEPLPQTSECLGAAENLSTQAARELGKRSTQSLESNALVEVAGGEGMIPKIIITEG